MQSSRPTVARVQQWLLIMLIIIPALRSAENTCRIKEHAPINSIVCSLNSLLIAGKQNLYLYSFKNIFKLNSINQLVVVNNIDRETLDSTSCIPSPEDSLVPYCRINVDLINKSKKQELQVIQIPVDVEDINDNFPIFDKSIYNINIDENIPPGHVERLPVARDLDHGINGDIVYSLEGKDKIWFDLIQSNKKRPMIKTLREFDRETKDKYELLLIASDNGHPKRTSEARLFVKIRDMNDNVPEFNFQKAAVIGIREDLPEGSKIDDIKVIDRDVDNLVSVYLDTNADSDVKKHFQVSLTSGITLAFRLNYESPRKRFVIPLIAVDNGIPSLTASSTLVVDVLDVNDNQPTIAIDSLSYTSTDFKVTENKPKESFIAMVTVQDDDSGINGVVDCSITEPSSKKHFELISQSQTDISKQKRNYQIVTMQEFDREKATHYQITVFCKDQGQPSLSSQQTITVWVEDENDNPPTFTRQHFQGRVKENSLPGTNVFVLRATDPDVGTHASTVYSIDPKYKDIVIIGKPSTGVVTSVVAFDREVNKTISFRAFAIDEQNPMLNSSVDITIEIEDENDCAPIFEASVYEFKIKEGYTGWIGKVHAYDNDTLNNGQVSFVQSGSIRSNLWIVRSDGNIFSERGQLLDREVQNMHHLTIEAHDHGSPSHSSSVVVQIQLEDINDNAPKFTQPSDSLYTITINDAMIPGSLVTKVVATDDDENENGKVTYHLLSNDHFTIDERSGEIYINKTLTKSYNSPRRLIVIAKDSGVQQLSSTLFMSITFQQDTEERDNTIPHLPQNGDRNNQNPGKRNFNENSYHFPWNSKEGLISLTVGGVVLILGFAGFLVFYIWCQSRPSPAPNKSTEFDRTIAGLATAPTNRKSDTTFSCMPWLRGSSRDEGKPRKSHLVSATNFARQQQKQREISHPMCDEQTEKGHVTSNNPGDMESVLNSNSPLLFRYQHQLMDMRLSNDSLNSTLFPKPTNTNTHFSNIYEPPLRSQKVKCSQNYSTIQLPTYTTTLPAPASVQVYNNSKYENPFPYGEQQNLNPSKNSYFVSSFAVPNPRINNSFV